MPAGSRRAPTPRASRSSPPSASPAGRASSPRRRRPPAPEPAHAIRAVIDEVERGEANVILFGLCGHGHFDLAAYDAYLAGTLEDPEFSEADMEAALARLPEAPAIA